MHIDAARLAVKRLILKRVFGHPIQRRIYSATNSRPKPGRCDSYQRAQIAGLTDTISPAGLGQHTTSS